MSHYTERDMQAVRTALNEQRTNLIEHIRAGLSESEQTAFSAILGRGNGDSGDEALATTLGDLAAARLDLEVKLWRELQAAEQRIDGADFGECAECGNLIPVARLIANPAATRCVECQSVFERTHHGQSHGSL